MKTLKYLSAVATTLLLLSGCCPCEIEFLDGASRQQQTNEITEGGSQAADSEKSDTL